MRKYNHQRPEELCPLSRSSPTRPRGITPYVHFPHSQFSAPQPSYSPVQYCHRKGYYLPHTHAYAHMHLYPESSYYYSQQWHVHPPAYYQELVEECPRDIPELQYSMDNDIIRPTYHTQPLPSFIAGQSSSGPAASAYSCDNPSILSIETQTSFYSSVCTGSGLSLRCAYTFPMSSSRRRGDSSGGSAQNRRRKGNGSRCANNRGRDKRRSSGSGDGSTKSGSTSAKVTNPLGIHLDENSTLLQIKGKKIILRYEVEH